MLSRLYRGEAIILLILIWLGVFGAGDMLTKVNQTLLTLMLLPVLMLIDNFLIFGTSQLKAIPFLVTIFTRSARSPFLAGIYVLVLLTLYPPFAANPLPNKQIILLALTITLLSLYLRRPFTFVLGSSANNTARILRTLSEGNFPLRTVSMLDRKRMQAEPSSFSWLIDDLRVHSEKDWRDVADGLLEFAPLIVLDARTSSPVVIDEVSNIFLKPGVLSKAFFVVEPDGSAPALLANGYDNPRSDVHVITESDVKKLLQRDYLTDTLTGWNY